MRSPAILAGACVLGVSGLALANPIRTVDEAYAQQYPWTSHVQLTRISSYPGVLPMEITRDGQVVTAEVYSASGPSRDLGSGMTTLSALLACDCNVPFGHHSYSVSGIAVEIDVIDATAANTTAPEPSARCDLICGSDVPVSPETGGSAGESSGGAAVPGMAGSGAADVPVSPEAGGSAGAVSGTDAVTDGTVPMAQPSNEGGEAWACSISRRDRTLVPLGILAALGLLAWRRRK